MKYALFSGSNYYPDGGIKDFRGWFDSIDAAQEHLYTLYKSEREWAEVANENLELVSYWKVQDFLYTDGEWTRVEI